jgi:uncharacterized protein YjiK
MMRVAGVALMVAASLSPSACAGKADASDEIAVLQERNARYAAALARTDSMHDDKPFARWLLPQSLSEISGIALTEDGRLLAHGDEHAQVVEVDYKRGVIVKHFLLGDKPVKDDFEGITRVGDRFFLMTSTGKLYEFREGADKSQVPFRLHDAELGKECELEGVAYDSTSNALVMPCKVVKDADLKGNLVLYRWSLDSTANPRVSRLSVPLKSIIGSQQWEAFHASDIAIDPATGNYVIVAAQEKGLIVITRAGAAVSARTLDDIHNQVEGVAITPDGVLNITDEIGKSQPAAITLYRWRGGAAS